MLKWTAQVINVVKYIKITKKAASPKKEEAPPKKEEALPKKEEASDTVPFAISDIF